MAAKKDKNSHEEPILEGGGQVRRTVGDILREARVARDEDLKYVAAQLRIRLPYLEAIEEGRLADLPGPTYAIGFVRAYADHLGLDSPALVLQFKEESEALARQTELVFPEPIPGSRIPGAAVILIGAVLAGIAYGGWLYVSSHGTDFGSMSEKLSDMVSPDKEVMDDQTTEAAGTAGIAESSTAESSAAESSTDSATESAPEPTTGENPASASSTQGEQQSGATAAVSSSATTTGQTEQDAASSTASTAAEAQSTTTPAPATASDSQPGAEPSAADGKAGVDQAGAANDDTAVDTPPAAPDNMNADAGTAEAAPQDASATTGGEASTEGQAQATAANDATTEAGESAAAPETPPSPPPAPDLSVENHETPPPVASSTPRTFGEENADARIVITARQDSWVQVTDADGNLLLTRLLQTGDSYKVPNRPGITMIAGSAGALAITVDGQSVPDIGPVGAVRRDVKLEPEPLKNGTAAN